MKLKKAKKTLEPFLSKATEDGDHFFIVHFSKEDDRFHGYMDIDGADALIVIRNLINTTKIDPEILHQMVINWRSEKTK